MKIDVSGTVDWEGGEMTLALALNLASAGIRLPSGRIRGEETLSDEYPRIIRPYLLSLPVDSASTVEDLISRREFSLAALDAAGQSAARIPPALSPDLGFLTGRYTVNLQRLTAALTRHRFPAEIPRLLTPPPAAAYTGIIIIADGELPVHGRNSAALARPCIFPKIWDSEMNLIYERNMVNPEILAKAPMVRYTGAASVFRPTPSGLEGELAALAGPSPLRILARGVFGIRPTDIIIDREDALKILASAENQRLLREGRVILALSEQALRMPLGGSRD